MMFHTPQKVVPRLILKMNNIELEPISDFNFLGIIINKYLRLKSHINKISINIERTTGIIRSLNQVLPCNVLLTIYNSLILPHLNYGILAWGYDATRIFKLHANSLRAISSTTYIAHTDPLFKSLALLKVIVQVCVTGSYLFLQILYRSPLIWPMLLPVTISVSLKFASN